MTLAELLMRQVWNWKKKTVFKIVIKILAGFFVKHPIYRPVIKENTTHVVTVRQNNVVLLWNAILYCIP